MCLWGTAVSRKGSDSHWLILACWEMLKSLVGGCRGRGSQMVGALPIGLNRLVGDDSSKREAGISTSSGHGARHTTSFREGRFQERQCNRRLFHKTQWSHEGRSRKGSGAPQAASGAADPDSAKSGFDFKILQFISQQFLPLALLLGMTLGWVSLSDAPTLDWYLILIMVVPAYLPLSLYFIGHRLSIHCESIIIVLLSKLVSSRSKLSAMIKVLGSTSEARLNIIPDMPLLREHYLDLQ